MKNSGKWKTLLNLEKKKNMIEEKKVINTQNKPNRKFTYIIILLLVAIIILTWQLIVTRSKVDFVFLEKIEVEKRNFDLQLELDSIMFEYNTIQHEFDSIMYEKDSIITSNAEEIQKLIASQADHRRIRRQLDHLRRVTQSYVLQIDSLHQVNTALKEENIRITQDFEREAQRSTQLTQVTEQLTEKVEIASHLRAYQTVAHGIRERRGDREDITDRARRADRIKVCFTISENRIVPEGPKTVYARIAKPNNQILSKGTGDAYAFILNDELVQYSMKKNINYRGRAENICLYWDKIDDFESGTYNISLFVDDYEIGQTFLELR